METQNAVFHQGLHCLLRQNRSPAEKELQYYLEIITIYTHVRTNDHTDKAVLKFRTRVASSKGPDKQRRPRSDLNYLRTESEKCSKFGTFTVTELNIMEKSVGIGLKWGNADQV